MSAKAVETQKKANLPLINTDDSDLKNNKLLPRIAVDQEIENVKLVYDKSDNSPVRRISIAQNKDQFGLDPVKSVISVISGSLSVVRVLRFA